ncbi:ubiquitin thioesterase zranb1-B-like [Portunus trituberculatus]|uniref:ubiquitin thioesterase zranb1-B-like n=1 Tax=Portunus trituberculatus TaxID=210409 RepID=UPI001E1CDBCC|nr:ubiquitin thioesterase zranb1-B-like [Portunus trituberculatus]XP_045116375.1 ubiquitin thioesterase zranb1-B-like [Portunus trituberculatus]XP_045116376.1 ubiquitin thioesterase zranb1-B-like [Portunus trituberculatus]
MSDGVSKWPCGRCTYLNFANAIRCTMCTVPRSPHLIVEAGADIYQLAPPSPTPRPPEGPPPQEGDKWVCHLCTYRNYPRALRCTQCRTPRLSLADQMADLSLAKPTTPTPTTTLPTVPVIITAASTTGTTALVPPAPSITSTAATTTTTFTTTAAAAATTANNRTATPTQGRAAAQSGGGASQGAGAEHQSPGGGTPPGGAGRCSPQGAGLSQSQTRPCSEPNVPSYKWRCRACTYENWPKSGRCVMCATIKGSTSSSDRPQPSRLATPPPPSEGTQSPGEGGVAPRTPEPAGGEVHIICESSDEQHVENNAKNRDNINEINKARSSEGGAPAEGPVIAPRNPTDSKEAVPPGPGANTAAAGGGNIRPGGEGAMALNNYETERLLRQLRRRLREADWAWLSACNGVVEGNYEPVEAYLSAGGDPMRQLTSADVKLLSRSSAFDEGHTLVHLAIRFGREDLLATILSRMDGGGTGVKRVPSYVAPDLANDIRRHLSASIRQRKGPIPCYFVSESVTFSLPAEIEDLPVSVQEQLFEELLDRDAQKQLEEDAPIINWSLEITDRLGARLYALWNRTAGDCLLDSILQATWGVFDRENVLRRALSDSLSEASHLFYPRWKEYERWQARLLDYYVPEGQVLEEWAELICLASQPGAALEQLHIFVLAHILRRPIIVYGVKCVKSFRGEDLGYARFEGVYLPLLWEPTFCWKSPIALGYTRGHFSALIPMEPDTPDNLGAGAILDSGESQVVFLPLMTHDAKLLPVHFVTQAEVGCEESLLRQWLEVCVSEGGVLVAQQRLTKKPLAVAQMTEEWLNHYRRLAQMECAPYHRPIPTQGYSSDGDSEEE